METNEHKILSEKMIDFSLFYDVASYMQVFYDYAASFVRPRYRAPVVSDSTIDADWLCHTMRQKGLLTGKDIRIVKVHVKPLDDHFGLSGATVQSVSCTFLVFFRRLPMFFGRSS